MLSRCNCHLRCRMTPHIWQNPKSWWSTQVSPCRTHCSTSRNSNWYHSGRSLLRTYESRIGGSTCTRWVHISHPCKLGMRSWCQTRKGPPDIGHSVRTLWRSTHSSHCKCLCLEYYHQSKTPSSIASPSCISCQCTFWYQLSGPYCMAVLAQLLSSEKIRSEGWQQL